MNIETDKQLAAEPVMAIDTADPSAGTFCCTGECRTRVVVDDFYQCQIQRSDCGYAVPFGKSYLCLSDLRRDYSSQQRQQELRQLESIL